jgi:hypothetical protein
MGDNIKVDLTVWGLCTANLWFRLGITGGLFLKE